MISPLKDDDKTTSPPRSSSSSTLRSSYASAGKGDKTYEVQLPPPGSYSPLMSSFDEYTDEDEDDDALQQGHIFSTESPYDIIQEKPLRKKM